MNGKPDLDTVLERRRQFWANGYRPIEIWSPDQSVNDRGKPLNCPGKQPRGRWRKDAAKDPPVAAVQRPDERALNTGIMCAEIVAFDVDVLDQHLVDQVVHLIETNLGPTPLVRVGRAPKILLVYRRAADFPKIQTPEFFLDGQKLKVEALAEGQQFVADGIHPDTGKPYTWIDKSPETVHFTLLPVVTEGQAREVVRRAEELLREAGAKPRKTNRRGGTFFELTNEAALADIAAWVRSLFPRARFAPGTGAWRVSSRDLGRNFEEDISIHPSGIRDFGEEITATPIDLVMRYGSARTAIEGALWLCDKLSIDPATLGYTPPPPPGPPEPEGEGVTLDDFYAYMPMHCYIYAPSREMWPAGSVNARIPPIPVGPVDENGERETIKANTWIDQNKPVEQMIWAPGRPMIIKDRLIPEGGWIHRKGVSCFNLYRPPSIKPGDPAKAGPWVDHVKKIYPEDAGHIVSWLAHRVQRPHDKINHALVLGGKQGIGKDTLLEPVKQAVGPWNFADVSPQQAVGRFNGFLKSVILRINEARDTGDTDRYKFYDQMKAVTAAPPDVLRVDEKNLREHSILNCCGVIITSNHKTDGIYLPADDRRHYVAWSDLDKSAFNDADWNKLWGFYEHGGYEHVVAYLDRFDLSDFDPKAPPPKTQAFWEIVDASRNPNDAELADVLDDLCQPDTVTLGQLAAAANPPFDEWLRDRKNFRLIPHRMEECGYAAVRNPGAQDGLWKFNNKRQVIYAKASLSLAERLTLVKKRHGVR